MGTWIRAAAVPLLVVGVALALWRGSDKLGYVGPLDKATFGWLIAMPIWVAAPAIAGYAWRGLDASVRRRATIAASLVIGGGAGFLLWLDAVTADCQSGLARTPVEFAGSGIVCGIAAGALFAFGLAESTSHAAAGHAGRWVATGAAAQLLFLIVVPSVAFATFFGVCARPH